MSHSAEPAIVLQNRQRRVPLTSADITRLRTFAVNALPLVTKLPLRKNNALNDLEELSIALISDRTMARLHRQFMGIAGPTDVLTFDHGEILISTETAARYAVDYGHSTLQEIALYILHGLLHLHGFDDRTPADHQEMHTVQNDLFQRLFR